jgi:hypothetical protein
MLGIFSLDFGLSVDGGGYRLGGRDMLEKKKI